MRPATLVAGSVVCATLGAADLGVLSIVVVPRWLGSDAISDAPRAKPPAPADAVVTRQKEPSIKGEPANVDATRVTEPSRVEPSNEALAKAKPLPEVAVDPKVAPPKEEEPELVLELTAKNTGPPGSESPRSESPRKGPLIVRFDLEKTDVGDEVRSQLSGLLATARPGDRFRVEGHADSTGREEGNRYFSRERGKAVARELVRMGVAPSRISTSSYGSTRPLTPGRTASAYERNRRVEIYLERSGR